MMDVLTRILNELEAAVNILFNPAQRLYWGYLAGALAIAVVVYFRSGRRRTLRSLIRYVFHPKVWLHKSSRTDAGLLVVNRVIRAVLIVPLALSAFGLALGFVGLLDETFGRPAAVSMPAWLVTGIYTVALFLAWDFSRYWVHRWFHTVPFLWQFHQVHHSAEVMTPICLYRAHPVEAIASELRGILVTGVMAGAFFYFFRSAAVEYSLLGVNVFGFALNALGGNLRHSHVSLGYGKFENLLVSPAQHQIHHSLDPQDYNKNFGVWLSIWDRLWGSFKPSTKNQQLVFGIADAERNHDPHSVASAIVSPFAAVLRRFRKPPAGEPPPVQPVS